MRTYSDPLVTSHELGNHDFGAGAGSKVIKGPEGCKGRVQHALLYNVTEAFTATTLPGTILIGTSADPDKHASITCATTGIGAVKSALDAELFNSEIEADEEVHIDFTAPTGGTPAGIGNVMVTIAWYK